MADIELQDWAALGQSITDEDRERHAPPADLFTRIEAGLANADAPSATSETLIPEDLAPEHVAPLIDLEAERTSRAPRARRRARRQMSMAAAAAAIIAVLGFSAVTGEPDSASFAATATNANLDENYDGTAEALVNANTTEISLVFSDSLPTEDPVELWLIKEDLSDMVSLGLVDADGSFVVPAGIDVSEYSVVDLSIEPDDGDATHSGRSILRGTLQST